MICYGKGYECEKSYYWIINVCTVLHHIKRADLTHYESGGGSSPRLRESDTHLAINHEESNCCTNVRTFKGLHESVYCGRVR